MFENLIEFQELYSERRYFTNSRKDKIYLNLPIFKPKKEISVSVPIPVPDPDPYPNL